MKKGVWTEQGNVFSDDDGTGEGAVHPVEEENLRRVIYSQRIMWKWRGRNIWSIGRRTNHLLMPITEPSYY